jgi:uncharacterized protein YbcV (DUF1398 family)
VFTIEQIDELHDRLGRAETLVDYVGSLAALGVVRYDSFVSDGHSEYVGLDAERVDSPPAHETLTVAEDIDRQAFVDHLKRHERGETGYLEMSKGLADSGVQKWTVDTLAMTMTFYDGTGVALLVEKIT